MVGWKRIVVTFNEKMAKRICPGVGAEAELVDMGTIFAVDSYGLPVSTAHVPSAGVAGTMAANGSGLHMSTLRNIALACMITIPAAMSLPMSVSAGLYFVFVHIFGSRSRCTRGALS
jgi:inorganic phosphate transporter, PiT family